MRVRFIGDPNDDFSGPNTMVYKGIEFTKNEWTKVEDEAAQRFATNNHFEVKEDAPKRGASKGEEAGE